MSRLRPKEGTRFIWLFFSLLALVLVTPVADEEERIMAILYQAGLTFMLLAAWWAVRGDEAEQKTALALAVPALIVGWVTVALPIPWLRVAAILLFMVFMVWVTVELVTYVARARTVTLDTIYAALSGYILVGLVFASFYVIADTLQPETLGLLDPSIGGEDRMGAAIYFSLVTLTTLGYGDISPTGGVAAGLAPVEAVLGQLYVAVLVARLVGIYTANQMAAQQSGGGTSSPVQGTDDPRPAAGGGEGGAP
jgi:hypothetical protein